MSGIYTCEDLYAMLILVIMESKQHQYYDDDATH